MNYKQFFTLLVLTILFQSCENEEDCCPMPETEAEFESGIFVLNEGNFGSANASVSYIDPVENMSRPEVFKNINAYSLGDTAQSMEMHDDLAIIVVNVSNKIEIVNRYNFKSLGTIDTNLSNPRFVKVIGDNLYVSNWGDGTDPNDDFIAVFNLSDLSFDQTISVAEGPEKMVAANGSLYVAHKGGFSFNNIISLIDSQSNTVTKEIEVGDLPNSMAIDGSDLWVLSSGKPSYADAETAGALTRINMVTNVVEESLAFPENTIHPANLSMVGNIIYMTIDKGIYKYNLDGSLPDTPEFTLDEVAVLYGFDIREGKIYVASPRTDFTGNGDLFIYDLNNGDLLDQFTAGINPNGIYFN